MAAAVYGDVTISEAKPDDERKRVIARAYSEIGGIPPNHIKTNAFKVGSAWRINIYTEVPSECFIKSARIEHSFYYKD